MIQRSALRAHANIDLVTPVSRLMRVRDACAAGAVFGIKETKNGPNSQMARPSKAAAIN